MKITGNSLLDAPASEIWPLVFDPRALLELLPGCEDIEQIAPDEYRARMALRIPAVAGSYDARVRMLEVAAPRFCRMEGEASGPSGSVRGQANFTLEPIGEQTRITYAGEALIAGPLAGMNPRFAEGVAQTLIRQGLARLPDLARQQAAAAPPPSARRTEPGWRAWLVSVLAALQRALGRFAARLRSAGG